VFRCTLSFAEAFNGWERESSVDRPALCAVVEGQAVTDLILSLRAEQHDQWLLGNKVPAEAYFERNPELGGDPEASVDLIYSEFLLRGRLGEEPDPQEFIRRFPQHADALRRQFELQAVLESLSAILSAPASASGCGSSPPRTGIARAEVGTRVGPYELLGIIGSGGMGAVYRARHTRLGRVVALKVAHAGPLGSAEARARFATEARAVARLRHPNVVCIYEFGEQGGFPYFAMELLDGVNLQQRLALGALAEREAAALMRTLADAVHYAHRQQVIHRDLKPANVLVGADGTVKLTDFGLAKLLDSDAGHTGPAVIGTPGYMAPEQARGDSSAVGPTTDVYGLGAILYEELTGRPPFLGATRSETIQQVLTQEPTAPSSLCPGVCPCLEAICLRCLAKDPARRYASAGALADALGDWLARGRRASAARRLLGRVARASRRHALTRRAALVVLGAGAASAWLIHSSGEPRRIEDIERDLGEGREVTLIGRTGGPAWSRWVVQGDPAQAPSERGGEFSVQSWGLGLLELVRDPRRDSFRLSAEVKHVESHEHGEAGVYVAYRASDGPGRRTHFFVPFSFNDIRPAIPVRLFPCLHAEGVPRGGDLRVAGRSGNLCTPAGYGRTGWRRLVLDVGRDALTAFWEDGVPIGTLRHREVISKAGALLGDLSGSDPAHPYAGVDPSEIAFRGGLGLYVLRGSAAFRSVVVTPT
jgi:serine/threonine protein kinase